MKSYKEQDTHTHPETTSRPRQATLGWKALGGRRPWRVLLPTLALGSMLAGCQMIPIPKQTAKLRIKAYIDGAATFYVQADSIRIKHLAYELPGRWGGAKKPVYINGVAWQPVWNGNESSMLNIGFGPDNLPDRPVKVKKVSYFMTLGSTKIVQQPLSENDYTLIVSIDDRGPLGANWYTVDLDW